MILMFPKTNSQQELAAIYTTADVFFNPTHEDNYPTVNLEAQACGTFVATYDVGGCLETLSSGGITIRSVDSFCELISMRKIDA